MHKSEKMQTQEDDNRVKLKSCSQFSGTCNHDNQYKSASCVPNKYRKSTNLGTNVEDENLFRKFGLPLNLFPPMNYFSTTAHETDTISRTKIVFNFTSFNASVHLSQLLNY
jgi:hypothetical protein